MSHRLSFLLPSLLLILGVASCGRGNQWRVHGTVEGVADTTMVAEAQDNGRWYVLDTVAVKGGRFDYRHAAMGYPDVYRLRMGDQTLYFPIDSIETVEVSATMGRFASPHLTGSAETERMMQADSLLRTATDREALKKDLARLILIQPSGITSYYIINKTLDGQPIFDPSNPKDVKVIGAVANAFTQFRPGDPRTKYLTQLYLENRRTRGVAMQAQQVRAFEIKLYDEKGVQHSLLDETGNGDVVVLNFTVYDADESPAFNIQLNKLYEKYRAQGLRIFQVSYDQDPHLWKASAQNLPWTTVLDPMTDGGKTLRQYNVQQLPATFVFDRNGDIAARADDIPSLAKAIEKAI